MFSQIKNIVITKKSLKVEYKDGRVIAVNGDLEAFFTTEVQFYTTNNDEPVVISKNKDEVFIDEELLFFCPKEMVRIIQKDFRQERDFDLSYRKHLVSDYSKDHYNLVSMDNTTPTATIEKVENIVRSLSTGKDGKPIGVYTNNQLVVIKEGNVYHYTL